MSVAVATELLRGGGGGLATNFDMSFGLFLVLGSSDYRWTTASTPVSQSPSLLVSDNDKYHQQWPVQSAACVCGCG